MNTQKFKVNSLQTAMFAAISAFSFATASHALEKLDDKALADVTGKELAQFTTIKPGELGNPNGDVGFYRLTLDAKMELNSNIDKLRLGCDNADGTNCDISIDKVVMSGIVPSQSRNDNGSLIPNNFPALGSVSQKLTSTKNLKARFFTPKNAGPSTDFVINKPFIELAIKNPNSLTNRKIVGYRFGGHEVWGAMSTGDGPTNTNGTAPVPQIIGPRDCSGNNCATFNPNIATEPYGRGKRALEKLYDRIKNSVPNDGPFGLVCYQGCQNERTRRFKEVTKEWVSYSIAQGHTGVNSISGRMPVRLDNFNLRATVKLGDSTTAAETAIVSANLSRQNASDFGRTRNGGANINGSFDKGYLRNVFLGDTDTEYTPDQWGNYVTNDNTANSQFVAGRAPTFKRASAADLQGMIVHVHGTILGGLSDALLGGDRFNNQTISTKLFHNLQFGSGTSYNGNNGSKHFAFQYQTLDGLQWITTDKRISTSYDVNGNPTGAATGPYSGYDWLSTRAGWWLESPMATVRDAFVPAGQILNKGAPPANEPIVLGNIDLGQRPVDNCYGNLTFC